MIKVAICGTSDFGLPSWQAVLAAPGITVVGAITQPAKPVGRRQVVRPSPVEVWATAHHRPTLTPRHWRDEAALRQLRDWDLDLLIVAAYGLIVPPTVLDTPKHGCLNIHASLLPAYRGASPIAAAIINGDATTGITFMQMDAGMDTGPIISQYKTAIKPDDTTPRLSARLAAVAADHIVAAVQGWVSGTLPAQPQSSTPTFAKKITRADGQMTWESGLRLERLVRAYTPWPGLWTTWQGQIVKVLHGSFVPGTPIEPPGTIVEHESGWAIVCQDGLFQPTAVQFEGKQAQPAERIPGSYPGFIGSRLGT